MKSSIKIGRDSSNDIEINEPRVSRYHAIITDLGEGNYELKDLGSTNGTFVNGKPISVQIIRSNDCVVVGSSIVKWISSFTNPSVENESRPIRENAFGKIRKFIYIGSSPQNDIVIENNFISDHHAKVSRIKNGDYFIEDTGSTNGTFVNGIRVLAKNFKKTDIIKIAQTDLPEDWFKHEKLKSKIFKDNKGKWIFSIVFLLIIGGYSLYNYYGCKWFGIGCDLSAEQIYSKNQNTIVRIIHMYYYKIDYKGRTYFVGKNKIFKVTEANLSRENLLPYNSIAGSGCIIKNDGTILTSFFLANPWINKSEQSAMLKEVLASRTIERFSLDQDFWICGETSVLKWLANGLVDNQQNYIEASSQMFCKSENKGYSAIKSVKQMLPEGAEVAEMSFDSTNSIQSANAPLYFYSYSGTVKPNSILKDTFFTAVDTFQLSQLIKRSSNIPLINEGSIVFNKRGELSAIIQQDKIVFLHSNY